MAVSDQDVMTQMAAGRSPSPPGASPSAGPGAAPPSPTAPAGAPMATPEPRMGNREGAMANVGTALDLLEQSIAGFGSESPEGKLILAAMNSLSKMLGPRKASADELQPAQIQQLLASLPSAGGGAPEQKAMMGGGGPPPGAAPPPGAGGAPQPMMGA